MEIAEFSASDPFPFIPLFYHFAKFRVVALSDTQVRFDWAYQIDPGNPQLARHPRSNVAFAAGEKRPAGE